ncbi:MAG: NlpC/P60 family protein [Bacteroidetes bacterium]|nr:NlpC/P60 family protein [Bacteroidota bacterium]
MRYFLKISCLLILFTSLIGCKSSSKIHKENVSKNTNNNSSLNYAQKLGYELAGNEDTKFLETVISWLGVPYKYGGCSKEGTDCSCFVNSFYKEMYGKTLARKSEDIMMQSIPVNKDALIQGDLVFFKITGEKVSHVGIYISKGHFIHATTSKGVMINNLEENYYKKYFFSAGRYN